MGDDLKGNQESAVPLRESLDADRESLRSSHTDRVEQIFFFPNGAIACTDSNGQRVTKWQTNLLCDRLKEMLAAGVIGPETKILGAGRDGLVSDWVPGAALERKP